MITPRQIRAARALLDWDQVSLAEAAGVALSALQRLEQGKPVRDATVGAVAGALAAAGVRFVSDEGREGVLRSAAPRR
jgi:transcriptional regulator with XRE-family HTH domain